ncbi:MAG: ROK family protein [Dehalococcoidia bacterium]
MEIDSAPQHDTSGIVAGVDIGGSKVALLITDVATGTDLIEDRYPTPADAGPTAMLEELFSAVRDLVVQAGRHPEDLRALGIAVPGYIDVERGRAIRAGNLAGWRDVPLRDIVGYEMGLPAYVDNDAAAAALGEKWRGAAKQMHNFVFLALGTGVGAGVMINGRLHRGFHNAAGEVGNFMMSRRALDKDRGGHGDLELRIGGPAVQEQTAAVAGRKFKVKDTFARADGDRRLRKVADRVADYIAMTVINITALLDPEAIIFGGGGSTAGEPLIERVRERVERELAICPALMRSTLGEDAQLHGAVFGALWQLHPELALREELR